MKKQLQLLVAAALALVSVQAMAQTKTIGKANNDQPVLPKPVLTVEYDVPITTIADIGEAFDPTLYGKWDLHADTRIITESGREVGVVYGKYTEEPGTEEGTIKSKLYFLVSDVDYLKPNERFTLYVSRLNDQPAIEKFEYQVMDYDEITQNTRITLTDYGMPLVISNGAEVTIDGSVSCTQMIVAPKCGVRINEGASLTVTDTAYFVGPQDHSFDYPWLINRGTFVNGDRTVFSRYMVQDGKRNSEYLYFPFALPIKSTTLGEMSSYYDMNSGVVVNSEQEVQPNASAEYWVDYHNEQVFNSNDAQKQGLVMGIFDYDGSASGHSSESVFRFKGEINDLESIEDKAEGTTQTNIISGLSLCTNSIDNHYQAPIDLKRVVEDGRTNFNSIYVGMYAQKYAAYNAFSGITTYDGPMQLGYVLPHINSGLAAANTSVYITEQKDDLTTFNEMKERYSEATEMTPYQYIRFYVEDLTEGSYYYGSRDVCAVYFIPQDEYDAIDDRNNAGNSKKYESQVATRFIDRDNQYDTAEGVYTFPYINSKGEKSLMNSSTSEDLLEKYSKELGLQIKVLPIPAEGNDQELVLQLIGNPTAKKMRLGILDYNLSSIGFADNDINEKPIKLHTTEGQSLEYSLEDEDVDSRFKYVTMTACKIKEVNLTFRAMEKSNIANPNEEQPGIGTAIDNSKSYALQVFALDNRIVIDGAKSGDKCEVKDINGVVVAQKVIGSEREELHISRKGIYFVTIVNEFGAKSSKVLVD